VWTDAVFVRTIAVGSRWTYLPILLCSFAADSGPYIIIFNMSSRRLPKCTQSRRVASGVCTEHTAIYTHTRTHTHNIIIYTLRGSSAPTVWSILLNSSCTRPITRNDIIIIIIYCIDYRDRIIILSRESGKRPLSATYV